MGTPALGTEANPLRVAIVGSGPSGFYAAEALLKGPVSTTVDMFERLPVPFGLVRFGVAPDHWKLKLPVQVYDRIARSEGFSFLGNVTVGRDVTIEQLHQAYHAVILAYGADSDRRLGIPGEDLPGSHSATRFVAWYNGHPEYASETFDLDTETAVVIGQGNVAIDVARILLKPVDELRTTDIAEHALDALSASRVREVHLIGRRGPAQAKFTGKELRELGELPDCDVVLDPADLDLGPACSAELEDKANFAAAKNVEIFRVWAARQATGARKRIVFHFLRAPAELSGDGRVERLVLERSRLSGEPFAQQAEGTGETEVLDCGLVFRSIGYKGRPIAGVPFDASRGTLPNDDGRVAGAPGLYATGWIKRGPSGIIGTNRACAVATVSALVEDLPGFDPSPKSGHAGLFSGGVLAPEAVVSYQDWLKLDAHELRAGETAGRSRMKVVSRDEMISIAKS